MQTSRVPTSNKGTKKLQEGKLQEAESFLQSAVSGQTQKMCKGLRSITWAMFVSRPGCEELKKAPEGKSTSARSQHSLDMGSGALQAIDDALAGGCSRHSWGLPERSRSTEGIEVGD